ncbi:MAG: SDR family oxidoreductase [Solirubrobacteraceae bacterium]|jgi:NAD(P)-dependent dehydrogenase (short-subunit alcohol dehydrogenase family)
MLEGQRVVVVGGTSGMGLATVRAAAAQGAEVVSAGRRSGQARETIDGVRQAEVDVTDEASVRALFDDVGNLDHLLVSASPGTPGPFLEQDLAAARTFIDGKLLGSWTCARYAAARMSPGGSITFITGCAVIRPPRNAATVTAAFAAVEALSRALALELGPLRVNTIRPGYTDSEMWSGLGEEAREDLRRRVAEALPVGRMGEPDDIAQAALFLMTSRQTTGAVLEVSGGEPLVDTVS